MINNHRVVVVVPARGGSKSIPKKNIKLIAGKPLITWTLDIAKQISAVDRVIVSTDDAEIAEVARVNDVEVMDRPKELAEDHTLTIEVIRDVIAKFRASGESAKYMIILEPTSPLRSVEDVDKALELLATGNYDSVASFTEAELNPHRAWKIKDNTPEVFVPGAIPWYPRQKQPEAYQLNGAVYALDMGQLDESDISLLFGRIGATMMPGERSVDIDNNIQWELVQLLLEKKGAKS